ENFVSILNYKLKTRTFGWNEVETKLHEQVVGRLVGVSKPEPSNHIIPVWFRFIPFLTSPDFS
ncbi:MAG: hypothetical protein KAX05_11995, partial [Bacteroidales bacterium]|nr:hypothetical protein [Bacteroidales bacterium]